VPRIVTLHDVQHRDQPDFFSRKALALRAVTYDRAARHANLVIVPSAFVKDAATSAVGLDPGRVRVIPHGVDHAIFRPGIGRRDPFVFYPARFWPHKNHARLFEAFALVKRERPELELVLSGGGHTGRKLPAGVRSVGLVDERRLVALYQTAEAMVFPSLYEGFGSPVLEAMACGCPVAASAAGSLPEVAGGAATLFDPRSADKIALGILRALEQRDSLSRRGLERAKEFTWDASAVAHDAVYAELLPCG
jgi:glycosyltransferase involved in cell wall biosynthesis